MESQTCAVGGWGLMFGTKSQINTFFLTPSLTQFTLFTRITLLPPLSSLSTLFTLFRLFLLIPTLTRLKLLILLYTASTLALIIMPIYIAIRLKHYWIVAQLASEQNVGWMNGWMGEWIPLRLLWLLEHLRSFIMSSKMSLMVKLATKTQDYVNMHWFLGNITV